MRNLAVCKRKFKQGLSMLKIPPISTKLTITEHKKDHEA